MSDNVQLNQDRARTLLSRVAPIYPDLMVVRMLNNAFLFASAKFGTPVEFELDSSGGCRCYDLEEAFEELEEAGDFTRDEQTGIMRISDALQDPADPFAIAAANAFPYMLQAMGKHPEIPGDDEDIRMFNEIMAMMLTLRQDNEASCREGECFGHEPIMELYRDYHSLSPSRQERANAMCQRVLKALDDWKV